MPTFKCLYLLANQYLNIIEIKRIDLPENAAASERFLWLNFNVETKAIATLQFRSMDSSGQIEERYFEEGFLKFDDHTGTYIEKFNSAQHQLVVKKPAELSDIQEQAIEDFLTRMKENLSIAY